LVGPEGGHGASLILQGFRHRFFFSNSVAKRSYLSRLAWNNHPESCRMSQCTHRLPAGLFFSPSVRQRRARYSSVRRGLRCFKSRRRSLVPERTFLPKLCTVPRASQGPARLSSAAIRTSGVGVSPEGTGSKESDAAAQHSVQFAQFFDGVPQRFVGPVQNWSRVNVADPLRRRSTRRASSVINRSR